MSSWLEWLILMRKTSAPALTSFSSCSGGLLEGPMVAIIFVRRCRFIDDASQARLWRQPGKELAFGLNYRLALAPAQAPIDQSISRSNPSVPGYRPRKSRFS